MSDTYSAHGLSDAQWRDCWAAARWQQIISASLEQIALCREATIEDRLSALMLLDQGLRLGLLNPITLTWPYPAFSRDVLLSISSGMHPPRWWKRRKRIRQQCTERVAAIRHMLVASDNFMRGSTIQVVNAPVGFIPKTGALLS